MRNPTTSARPRRLFSPLLLTLLVLALTASCRSAQTAYYFNPAMQPGAAAVAAPVVPDSGKIAPAAPTVATLERQPAHQPARPALRRPRLMQRQPLRYFIAQAAPVQQVMPAHASRQSAQHAARPRQVSEVGLGTTVLGVLGLIVLPISLVGLLIWGGPVWASLAGLAGLAVLVAYLDPFG